MKSFSQNGTRKDDKTRLPVVQLTEVSKHYQQGSVTVQAVEQVTLWVEAGDFLIITGRSGSGKTTLLSLMGGLTMPTAGEVNVFGKLLAELDDAAISALRAERLGFVFQFASLLPTLTALDNARLPGLFAKNLISPAKAAHLLTWVGLADKLDSYPAQLSGGQQTRVAVARALANHPSLLLADEPTGNLDVETEREILALFRELNQNEDITIIMVSHNPELARYGNRHLIMENGALREVQPWPQGGVLAHG